jgi:hypothetical protein
MLDTITLSIYPAKSKARPRFTKSGRTHMPPEYVDWCHTMGMLIKTQWQKPPVVSQYVIIVFHVFDHRSDIDNLSGSVLDTAVKAGKEFGVNVLDNDNLNHVPNLLAFSRKVKSDPKIYFHIIHSDPVPAITLIKFLIGFLFSRPLDLLPVLQDFFSKDKVA